MIQSHLLCGSNWQVWNRVNSLPGAVLGGRTVGVGSPRLAPHSDAARSTPGTLPSCDGGGGRSTPRWLPSRCSLRSREGSSWKARRLGIGGCECLGWGVDVRGGFFTHSCPLRLNGKCFSRIPVCPSGCFGVGENTCRSPCNSHGFNANTEQEFQDLVKCGFFSKGRLMAYSAACNYIFWQSLLD